ncbi:MAG: sulfotransferase [Myxococcales bacterium]|nr:sulfotransferase [Myxococcales bacterium]MCB9553694.1 sulfotransferase [Myxococcales bacterium]
MTALPLLPEFTHPERLPGEPADGPPSAGWLAGAIALRCVRIAALVVVGAPLWPVFLLLAWRLGWPPTAMRWSRARRWWRLIGEAPAAPRGPGGMTRGWLRVRVVDHLARAPFAGLAWLLDELLWGRRLDGVAVVAPLIEISAARSGSTQLARYLEADETLAAPSAAQMFLPWLWLWRVARRLGRGVDRARLDARVHARLPPAFAQRHEGDLFGTDTFEAPFYLAQGITMSLWLGPECFAREFGQGALPDENRGLWEGDFVAFFDRIARKTLLFAGPLPDGTARRVFIKGHFLAAADALARRYPDARFLTMARAPGPRIQSTVNFLRANPIGGPLGPPPWGALAEGLVRSEIAYCESEMAWFGADGADAEDAMHGTGPRRCVLRFDDYVRDLEGTMAKVYRECLDRDVLPPHVPRSHAPRVRKDYLLDRSLAQLGIDAAGLDARLSGYRAWCRGDQSATPSLRIQR